MKTTINILALLVLAMLTSCDFTVGDKGQNDSQDSGSFSKLNISKDFTFNTVNSVDLSQVSSQINPNTSYRINDIVNNEVTLGVVDGAVLAEMKSIDVPFTTESINLIPQRSGFGGDIIINPPVDNVSSESSIIDFTKTPLYGNWNNDGVPENLLEDGDNISESLLDAIDNTLPSGQNIRRSPNLQSEDNLDIQIEERAKVWITFVGEGADWQNSLGYYTYELSDPPASVDDINQFNLIFPNASLSDSGGDLEPGDKVFLGEFQPGIGIGWFLVADGWDSNSQDVTVDPRGKYLVKYSNPEFNDFVLDGKPRRAFPDRKQHAVVLEDVDRELLILGFEDQSRDFPNVDHDMNDAIFYATVTPFTAVGNPNLPKTDPCPDTDGDGISDCADCFPDDPDRAFKNYFPGENQKGTLMYEDLWPNTGDYDFNDLVVDYNITTITDADGNVKDLEIDIELKAVGGIFKKAMALTLPVDVGNVESIKGQQINGNSVFDLHRIGIEDRGSQIVFPFFDDAHSILPPRSGSGVTNVVPGQPTVPSVTNTYTITFQKGEVSPADLGTHPYDFFIVTQDDRSLEIHLKGKPNVAASVAGHFGTNDDDSNPGQNNYFATDNGLPWALHITSTIPHTFENEDFADAYPNFTQWAESDGATNIDWFEETNRNSELIYK